MQAAFGVCVRRQETEGSSPAMRMKVVWARCCAWHRVFALECVSISVALFHLDDPSRGCFYCHPHCPLNSRHLRTISLRCHRALSQIRLLALMVVRIPRRCHNRLGHRLDFVEDRCDTRLGVDPEDLHRGGTNAIVRFSRDIVK